MQLPTGCRCQMYCHGAPFVSCVMFGAAGCTPCYVCHVSASFHPPRAVHLPFSHVRLSTTRLPHKIPYRGHSCSDLSPFVYVAHLKASWSDAGAHRAIAPARTGDDSTATLHRSTTPKPWTRLHRLTGTTRRRFSSCAGNSAAEFLGSWQA